MFFLKRSLSSKETEDGKLPIGQYMYIKEISKLQFLKDFTYNLSKYMRMYYSLKGLSCSHQKDYTVYSKTSYNPVHTEKVVQD